MRKQTLKKAMAWMLILGMTAGNISVQASELPSTPDKSQTSSADVTDTDKNYIEGEAIILYYDNALKVSSARTTSLLGPNIEIADTCIFEDAGEILNPNQAKSAGSVQDDMVVSLVRTDKLTTDELMNQLKQNDKIVSVQPNYTIHACSNDADPYEKYQWALENNGQNNGTAGLDVNASHLEGEVDDKERVIALVDTGMNYTHEDLKELVWNNTGNIEGLGQHGYDCYNDDDDPMDDNGHGSHCAGIMAASGGNGTGIKGIAQSKNIKIMPLKILSAEGAGNEYSSIKAYQKIYAAMQAGVNIVAVNNSWGRNSTDNTTSQVEQYINLVGKMGALSVCAAGNDGADNDTTVNFPANADSDYVISVAATNEKDELAGFSNYGKTTVDLAAPGADILSTVATDTFNPGIYEDTGKYCSTYEDFSDGQLVQTVGQNANGQTAQNGDIAYGTYSNDKSASEKVNVELTEEDNFGTSKGKSLKWTIKNATQNASYCLYLPYTPELSNTALYDSIMVKAYGPKEQQSTGWFGQTTTVQGSLYVMDSTLEGGSIYSQTDCTVINGLYANPNSNYWNHFTKSTMNHCISTNQRVMVFQIDALAAGDYTVYIDDFGVSKANVNADSFGKYEYYNGTSMATPYVTGAVAAIANACPDKSASDIKETILNNVRKTDNLSGKVVTSGVLDLQNIKPESAVPDKKQPEDIGTIATISHDGSLVSANGKGYYITPSGTVYHTDASSNTMNWVKESGSFSEIKNRSDNNDESFTPESSIIYTSNRLWTVLKASSQTRMLASYNEKDGWSKIADLPESMNNIEHYTLASYQGNLYFIGGLNTKTGSLTTQVLCYDTIDNTFDNAASLPENRAFSKAVQTGSELVVTLGTSGDNSVPKNLIFDGGGWKQSNASLSFTKSCDNYEWQTADGQSRTISYYDAAISLMKNGIVYVGSNTKDYGDIFCYLTKQDTYQDLDYTTKGMVTDDDAIWAVTYNGKLYILYGKDTVKGAAVPLESAEVAISVEQSDKLTGNGLYLPGDRIRFASSDDQTFLKKLCVNGEEYQLSSDHTVYYIVGDNEVSVTGEFGYYITGLTLPESIELATDESKTLSVTILPENADDTNLVWESREEQIATVDANGNVTGIHPGTTRIVVHTEDGTVTAECEVTVKEISTQAPTTEETTTQETTTTEEPDTTQTTATTQERSTTEQSDTTAQPATTQQRNTTENHTTTRKPTTTENHTTTRKPATTQNYQDTEETDTTQEIPDTEETDTTQEIPDTEETDTTQETPDTEETDTTQEIPDTEETDTTQETPDTEETDTTQETPDTEETDTTQNPDTEETIPVNSILLNYEEKQLRPEETLQLGYIIFPLDATNRNVEWYSSDDSIATVDENGLVTAIQSGEVIITVKTMDGSKTAECYIKIENENTTQEPDNPTENTQEPEQTTDIQPEDTQDTENTEQTTEFRPDNTDDTEKPDQTTEFQPDNTDDNLPQSTEEPDQTTARPNTTNKPAQTTTRPTTTKKPAHTTTKPTTTEKPAHTTTKPTTTKKPAHTTTRPSTTKKPAQTTTKPNTTEKPAQTTARPTTTGKPITTRTPAQTTTRQDSTQKPAQNYPPTSDTIIELLPTNTQNTTNTPNTSATTTNQTTTRLPAGTTQNPLPTTFPVTPVKVTGLKKKLNKARTLKLSWNTQPGVKGYKISRYNAKTKKYTYYSTTKTTITFKKLKKNTTYKFKVRAYTLEDSGIVFGKYSKVLKVKIK